MTRVFVARRHEIVFPSSYCFRVDGRKRFEYATCERIYVFFWKTEKKPPFSKISGYESTRPKKTNSDGGENVI